MVVMQRQMDRSVRRLLQRLLLGLGLLMLGVCLVFGLSSWRQQAGLGTVFADRVVPLHDLQRIHQGLNLEAPGLLEAGDEQALAALQQRIVQRWQKYLATYLTEEESRLVQALQPRLDALLLGLRGGAASRERYAQALQHFNQALAPLLDLQVQVAEQELGGARQASQLGLGLAVAFLIGGWLLIAWAHRLLREQVVWPLRVVADAVAGLAGPEPKLGPEAQALHGDFAEIAEQLQRLRVGLDERVQLQARTEQLLAQLQGAQQELVEAEKLASLGSLVAGVSHELNTPLGVAVAVSSGMAAKIDGLRVELAGGQLRRSSLDGLLASLLEGAVLLQRNLHRAAALITSFKQVAVDRSSMQRRRFDLGATLDELLDSLRPVYGRRGAELVNEVGPGVELDSYPGPLGQVISNLVVNAVLHGFDGKGGRLRIALLERGAAGISLLVEDNGGGMAPEVRERAFEPFFTTRLGQGGSGLGLAIVRSLVLGLLGGRLELSSEPGQGCRFVIHLPTQAPQREPTR